VKFKLEEITLDSAVVAVVVKVMTTVFE